MVSFWGFEQFLVRLLFKAEVGFLIIKFNIFSLGLYFFAIAFLDCNSFLSSASFSTITILRFKGLFLDQPQLFDRTFIFSA